MFAVGDIICQLDWECGFEIGVVRWVTDWQSFGVDLLERNGERIDERTEIDKYVAKASWEKCDNAVLCQDCGGIKRGNKKHMCQLQLNFE